MCRVNRREFWLEILGNILQVALLVLVVWWGSKGGHHGTTETDAPKRIEPRIQAGK